MPIKIVFFDCDGTLTTVKSSWEYLHRMLNIWDNNADRYQYEFRKGMIDYGEFCKRDALLWKGVNVSKVMEVLDKIPYHEGVKETIDALRVRGIYMVIISTGLSLLVNRVKKDLAIDMAFSNNLLVYDGVLSGEVRVNVVFNEKDRYVKRVLEGLNITPEEACAVGDGEGDKGMFEMVGLPVFFSSSDEVIPPEEASHVCNSIRGLLQIIERYNAQKR